MDSIKTEIANAAARLIVEEGLEYGAAKKRAARDLGANARGLPNNDEIEDAVREYISIFCADTQPQELLALRQLAATWMERMSAFRPYLSGAVWQGTATRLSDVYIQLFCDDSKSAELEMINQSANYDANSITGFNGKTVDKLSLNSFSDQLEEYIGVHFVIYDYDDLRGAMKHDSKGRSPRGNLEAVLALIATNQKIAPK